MSMSDMEFRAVLLDQMKDYLDGRITKEEYYNQAEPFYTEYANTYENPLFHKVLYGYSTGSLFILY